MKVKRYWISFTATLEDGTELHKVFWENIDDAIDYLKKWQERGLMRKKKK